MTTAEAVIQVESNGEMQRVAIAPLSVCRIGRDPTNDIVLGSGATSRTHAMIRRDMAGRCFLSDAGSRNGTQLNGLPVTEPAVLNDGDEILIGGQRLVFQQDAILAPLIESGPTAAATQVFLSTTFVTVFVADIRGFTALAREIGETAISSLLSEFFAGVGAVLKERRCWYQKYIGDCVMGLWVHDSSDVDRHTLATILDATLAVQALAAPLQTRFNLRKPVTFGVGINSGTASIGNLGSASAADFTAVGDSVNLAFRLEAATRPAGVDMLIGRDTIERIAPAIDIPSALRPMAVELKGYEAAEPAFALDLADLPALAGALLAPPSEQPRRAVAS
jgi:adenylate cyclase